MSYPTIPLMDIAAAWRDALLADAAIEAYCQARYGKPLKVYLGLNRRRPPTEKDCPLVVIDPGSKIEGEGDYSYAMPVGWAVYNEAVTTIDQSESLDVLTECDELGQLILACLTAVSLNNPITTIQYDIECRDWFPQCRGEMTLQIELTPGIGGILSYP